MILHLAFPVKQHLGDVSVLLWPKVRLAGRSDLVAIIDFAHFVHLHLLEHDLADGLLLLLALQVDGHVEAVVFLLEGFELLFILYFPLLGPHELHLKAFSRVSQHRVHVFDLASVGSQDLRLVLLGVERRILDELIHQVLLLLAFKAHFVRADLIHKHVRVCLEV